MDSSNRPADTEVSQPLLRDWHEGDGGDGGNGGDGVRDGDGPPDDAPRSRLVRELLCLPNRFSWIFLTRCVALVFIDMGAISCSIEYSRWSGLSYRSYTAWLGFAVGLAAFALYCVQPYLGGRWRRIGAPVLVVLDFATLSAIVTAAAYAFIDRDRLNYYYPHPELLPAAVFDVVAGAEQAIVLLDSFARLIRSLASQPEGQIGMAAA